MALHFVPLDDAALPAHVAPLESKRSPHANAGGGGAIIVRPHYPGPAGTAVHQTIAEGFTEGPPWDPIDPVRERFTLIPTPVTR